jgi:hypothetical protein
LNSKLNDLHRKEDLVMETIQLAILATGRSNSH